MSVRRDSTVLWRNIGSSFYLTNTCHALSLIWLHTHTHTHTQCEIAVKSDKTIFVRKTGALYVSYTHNVTGHVKLSQVTFLKDMRMFPYSCLLSKRQWGLFPPAKKWPKRQANLTTQLSTEIINVWSFTSALSRSYNPTLFFLLIHEF